MHQGSVLRLVAQGLRKPLQTLSFNHIQNRCIAQKVKFAPVIELDFSRIEELDVSTCITFSL